jgi:uncharacterized protein YndB with AHSA1/START domain
MDTRMIERTVVVNRPADEVWSYLTDAPKIEMWFASGADSRPVEGGAYRFTFRKKDGTTDHVRTGKYTAVERPARVGFDWDFGAGPTNVDIDLKRTGAGTEVRLRHTGFGSDEPSVGALAAHDEGWAMFLGNLKSVIEDGKDQRGNLFG